MATHPIILYPKGIRNANKLPVEDLKQLAKFNRVVLNYIKMNEILEKSQLPISKRLMGLRSEDRKPS